MGVQYFIGLDLGQAADYTALAVVERPPWDGLKDPSYAVRYLRRFPLGTPYPEIVQAVSHLGSVAPLAGKATLVVDQTGVGRAVVDMLRRAPFRGRLVPVTISAGHTVTIKDDGSQHVPKKELVTCLQLLLQGRRLKIARSLPDTEALVTELLNFRVKITAAANETFGAAGESQHDDLVLALALPCWLAESEPRWQPGAIGGGKSLISRFPKGTFVDAPLAW